MPIPTIVVCFSRLLKCLRSLYGKQCGPRSDCSWVHAVCFYTWFVSNVRQLFTADNFSRWHFQTHFLLGALKVKQICVVKFIYRKPLHSFVVLKLAFLLVELACGTNLYVIMFYSPKVMFTSYSQIRINVLIVAMWWMLSLEIVAMRWQLYNLLQMFASKF